jgi:hypothetical protein
MRWTLGPTLLVGGFAAGLTGCSNSAGPSYPAVAAQTAQNAVQTQTFKYTGHKQTFQVPAGVTSI